MSTDVSADRANRSRAHRGGHGQAAKWNLVDTNWAAHMNTGNWASNGLAVTVAEIANCSSVKLLLVEIDRG